MLGVGESRSPVFSPGSMEPRREAGPAAMGHPPWGSSMGFTLSTSEMGSIGPCPLDRPSTARRGGGPERSPVGPAPSSRVSSHRVGFCWGGVWRSFGCRLTFPEGQCRTLLTATGYIELPVLLPGGAGLGGDLACNDIVANVASASLATVTTLIVAPELNNLTFGPPLKVDAAPTVVPQASSAPNNLILILFLR